MKKNLLRLLTALMVMMFVAITARADFSLPDGSKFDPSYYAAANPDVVAAVGSGSSTLSEHYWNYGIQEGRLPYAGASDVSAASLVRYINEYRAANGLSILTVDATVQAEAQLRAREMADSQCFSHTRPNGEKWQTAFGSNWNKTYSKLGEDLARGQSSAERAVSAWKKSPGHNEVLLKSGVTRIGAGVAKGTDGKFYFVITVVN